MPIWSHLKLNIASFSSVYSYTHFIDRKCFFLQQKDCDMNMNMNNVQWTVNMHQIFIPSEAQLSSVTKGVTSRHWRHNRRAAHLTPQLHSSLTSIVFVNPTSNLPQLSPSKCFYKFQLNWVQVNVYINPTSNVPQLAGIAKRVTWLWRRPADTSIALQTHQRHFFNLRSSLKWSTPPG